MKKLLFIILLIAVAYLLSGCVTKRACDRKFPPEVQTNTKETIIKTTRDTTIIIQLPGDTAILEKEIPVIKDSRGLLQTEKSFLTTDLAYSFAWVQDGKLKHELFQKSTEFEKTIKNAISEAISQKETKVDNYIKVNELSGWQWAQIYAGRLLLIALALLTLFLLIRKYVPFRHPP